MAKAFRTGKFHCFRTLFGNLLMTTLLEHLSGEPIVAFAVLVALSLYRNALSAEKLGLVATS